MMCAARLLQLSLVVLLEFLSHVEANLHLSDPDAQIHWGDDKQCSILYEPGPPPHLASV